MLLVDATSSIPTLAALGFAADGFQDLLAERASYSDVIATDPASSVQVICAGDAEGASLLASRQLQPILLGLVHAYDAAVLDCGPVASADAQTLMWLADQCVMRCATIPPSATAFSPECVSFRPRAGVRHRACFDGANASAVA